MCHVCSLKQRSAENVGQDQKMTDLKEVLRGVYPRGVGRAIFHFCKSGGGLTDYGHFN